MLHSQAEGRIIRASTKTMLISNLTETMVTVLAIGDGAALRPLTTRRATAALPYAGNYRVIDFALTNCLHSGLRRITVFTQFNSLSLQNHLRDGWSIFNTDLGEFVTPVSPPVSERMSMYTGAAHALYQNLYLFDGRREDTILVVSGEQIYRMDYAAILEYHAAKNAVVTIAHVDEQAHGAAFQQRFVRRGDEVVAIVDAQDAGENDNTCTPMGVYCFQREKLIEMLLRLGEVGTRNKSIMELIRDQTLDRLPCMAYRFGGESGRVSQDRYWRTLSNLDQYYRANMDLLELEPALDLYQADWPIRTYQTQRPPARTVPGRSCNEGICVNSIVSGGAVIAGGGVSRSVLGSRVYIDDGATVEDAILYTGVSIGEGARVQHCICDRNVAIPAFEEIGIDHKKDAQRFHVTPEGVVVIAGDHEW